VNRSAFLSGTAAAAIAAPGAALAYEQPDHIVRIEHAAIKVAPNRYVETTTYNGQFPGPLLRMREGRPVVIDVHNATLIPEQLHFHGQTIPADVDGAAEERTPYIPARAGYYRKVALNAVRPFCEVTLEKALS
jgi:FtsP/CotA-like multicopper oxidase with cupredoxin domain